MPTSRPLVLSKNQRELLYNALLHYLRHRAMSATAGDLGTARILRDALADTERITVTIQSGGESADRAVRRG